MRVDRRYLSDLVLDLLDNGFERVDVVGAVVAVDVDFDVLRGIEILFVSDDKRGFDGVKQILFGNLALETQRLDCVEEHHILVGCGIFSYRQSIHSLELNVQSDLGNRFER